MIALASATGQARTLPASRTSAGGMVPCSMQFLMLPVLRSSDRPSSVCPKVGLLRGLDARLLPVTGVGANVQPG